LVVEYVAYWGRASMTINLTETLTTPE